MRLVDDTSLRQVWGERYDGDWEELPSFQEEAARAIVAGIPIQVEQAELERVRHREIASLSAYEHCLRGREYQRSTAHASHAKALECFSRALEQDPNSAAAHCGLACCVVSTGGITPMEEERRRETAITHAQQAIELDPLDPQGHWLLGMLFQMRRDFAGARLHLDRAIVLSPGDVETLGYTAWNILTQATRPAAGQAERSIRLNPCYPPMSVEQMGKARLIEPLCRQALLVAPITTLALAVRSGSSARPFTLQQDCKHSKKVHVVGLGAGAWCPAHNA